jgi:lipoprotein-anchoring transpeptidase ErfK/SrfK
MRLKAKLAVGALLWLVGLFNASAAHADVRVRIDKSSQTMTVWVNGYVHAVWPVSTGRGRYATPGGAFRPQRLEPRWYSRRYNNAPMHNAIFFNRGYAIHGTTEVGRLGRPASHGCVRLHPSHAAELYTLVRTYGAGRTRIWVAR